MFELARQRTERQEAALGAVRPEPFVPPVFVPKHPEIPRLESYGGLFSEEYWAKWPFNGLKKTPDPWISPYRLFKAASDSDYHDLLEVSRICTWLSEGAPVGPVGASRLPARGANLKGMLTNGYEACDALATWISQGLIMGPFRYEDLPVESLCISPLNAEIKPNSREYILIIDNLILIIDKWKAKMK